MAAASRAPWPPPNQLLRAFPIPAECHCTSTANRRPRRALPLASSAATDGHRRCYSRATTGFHGQQGHRELSRVVPRMRMEPLVLTLPFSLAHRRRCSPAAVGRGCSRPHTWSGGHGPLRSMPQAHADASFNHEAGQPIHRRCRPLLARGRSLPAAVLCFPRHPKKTSAPLLSLSFCVCLTGRPG
jgi:hypothetical protein